MEDKKVFNTYWGTELTNKEKEFLNHTIANYRVEYDIPFEQIEVLKDACINELRVYRNREEYKKLKMSLEIQKRLLEDSEAILGSYRERLTPRKSLTVANNLAFNPTIGRVPSFEDELKVTEY